VAKEQLAMKSTELILLILIPIYVAIPAGAIMAAQSGNSQATVTVEKFNPPAELDEYNALVEVITVTNIPGSPKLVLHIPCLRSKISPNNSSAAGRGVSPGVVEGCRLQKIPTGRFAGDVVNELGEIVAIPNS
jgi:hypothetical protein